MKRVIRISESELNRLVKEAAASVAENVDEIGDTPQGQYALGQLHARNVHGKYDNVSAIDGPSADMYDEIEKRRGGDEWDDGVCKNPLYYDYADGYTDWIAHKVHGPKGSAGSGVNEGKTIRLTESELHNMVKETVMSVLNENKTRKGLLNEGEQWIGEFDTDTFDALSEKVNRTNGRASFQLNGKDFTIVPTERGYRITSGGVDGFGQGIDFGYDALSVETALRAAYKFSTGYYKGRNENINEYGDWKGAMLSGDAITADRMIRSKYNQQGVSSNGVEYKNFVGAGPKNGYASSYDTTNGIKHERQSDNRNGFGHDYSERHKEIRDYDAHPMCAPEIKDFQKQAGDDLEDYYSGNYANRLRQKASQLGNTKSGQDFTPNALKEAISRAIRRYLR